MLRAALLTLFILVVLPATASAACRTAPDADVWYDSPVLQVWEDRDGFVSCLRPTGQEFRYPHPGTLLAFDDAWEDRWLSLEPAPDWEGRGGDDLPDLGTTYDTWTGEPAADGWRLRTGRDGVVLHRADGTTQVIDPTPVTGWVDFAYHGSRVFWRTRTGARTAVLDVPADTAAPAARPVRARRQGKCRPRPGATLVVRHRDLVLTRKGRSVHACFGGRAASIGDARAVEHLGVDEIAYRRPGFAGTLSTYSRRKRELPSAGGRIAANWELFAAVDRTGVLRAWLDGNRRPAVLTGAGASEVTVRGRDVFWLAPDGTARVRRMAPTG
jgi:hypothetical protein